MTLSVFVFASAVVDLFTAKNLIAFYNQIPTLFAAVLPSYLWLFATAGLPIWRMAYGDLLVGFTIWHLGQVVSAAALGNGGYHAGLFDLPWAARLRRRWPGLPVLFISGYAEPLVEGPAPRR